MDEINRNNTSGYMTQIVKASQISINDRLARSILPNQSSDIHSAEHTWRFLTLLLRRGHTTCTLQGQTLAFYGHRLMWLFFPQPCNTEGYPPRLVTQSMPTPVMTKPKELRLSGR